MAGRERSAPRATRRARHSAQLQQRSWAAWQLARAVVHLLAAQSSPVSSAASSQIRSWLWQTESPSLQTSVQRGVAAGWQAESLVVGVANGSATAAVQAGPLQLG